MRVWGVVAAVSLIDIGALDRAAGELLSGFDDGTQRVAIIRIAGQRPGVQHELATRCPGIGGDDGSLHTELIRRAGLALADALHLRSVEGIQLPAALALLLRADLIGARKWPHECRLEFTGEEFFQHEFPHERSDLSHWRKRLGNKLELLLAESLRVAHESGALRTKDLARVTVDTTVQPKNITFPTDAKLLHAAIKGLTRLARKHGVRLRQSYLRIAKRAAMMAGRYAHAKQFNRHRRQLRVLRTRLGRLIRDIGRKIAGCADLEAAFVWPLARADQLRPQQQRQRGWKLYFFQAPEVECIGMGKASAPYVLGVIAYITRRD